jgi:branched-chain amino acid transport system substrate-binding protein
MKKILSYVLIATMSLGFIGCKPADSGSKSTEEGKTSVSNQIDTGTEGEILIGCLQDITGPTSTLGKSVEAGARAAVEEINANGGISGKKIVMKTYDTKGDVSEAVNSYISGVTVDKVQLMIGPPVANIAHAVKETSESYDVPIMGFALDPTCQIKEDGSVYKNMFCFQPSADSQGKIMASFAMKNGYKSFGVLYNQENSYSVSLLKPFLDTVAEGGHPVDEKLIVAYGAADTDYKTLLQPLVSAKVDAIYIPNYTQQLVAIVTAGNELGYEGKYIAGLDAAPSFNEIIGTDVSNVYYINNINIFDEKTAEKAEAVSGEVSAVNKYFLGYDVVYIAKQCIEEAGLEDPAKLRSALENVKDFQGLTGTLTIDPKTHMPDKMAMFMYTYDNMTPVLLEEYSGE